MKNHRIIRTALLTLLSWAAFAGTLTGLAPRDLTAANVTLAWDPNTETNLAGYKLYYGPTSGSRANSLDVSNRVTATVSNLVEGRYFFVVTAYDTERLESDPSNEVSWTAPGTPPTIGPIANQTVPVNSSTPTLTFQVTDAETPAGSLTVVAASSNLTLVPLSRIVLGGSGTNRTVQVTPATGLSGTAVITLTVTDNGSATASRSFTVTVPAGNTPPTISAIPNQTVAVNTPTAPLPFQVSDAQTSASNLIVTASSSHSWLVIGTGITLGGSGTNRTIRITPVADHFGAVNITLIVTDGGGASVTNIFRFSVPVPNAPPTLTAIQNQTVTMNSSTPVLAFQVGDTETPAANLVVVATSTNTTLVPLSRITLGGSGTNRTAQITPATNQSGSTLITLTVNDGGGAAAARSFLVTVPTPNSPPLISAIPNQTVATNVSTPLLPFQIGDAQTPAGNLVITASSSHSALVTGTGISLGGSGSNRTIRVTPVTNRFGAVNITLIVTDGGGASATNVFRFTVLAPNSLPTISPIEDQIVLINSNTPVLPFQIGDVETPAASLIIVKASSNPTIVPLTSIVLGGSGANRTVQIIPATNRTGEAAITLTVNDGGGLTVTRTFAVIVPTPNSPPVISAVANQTVAINTPTAVIPFQIADVETSATNLVVVGSSSHAALVRYSDIHLGGSGLNRTVQVFSVPDRYGAVTITLRVTDAAGATATTTFRFTVPAP